MHSFVQVLRTYYRVSIRLAKVPVHSPMLPKLVRRRVSGGEVAASAALVRRTSRVRTKTNTPGAGKEWTYHSPAIKALSC